MAQRGEVDWQINKSVLEVNRYMLESGIASDVVFRLQSLDGVTTDIPVHKYILISRSPVFEALFCGGFQDPSQHVSLSDVEPDAFREFLKYLYYEEVHLTPDNVLPVLYVAKKYLLSKLAKFCMSYLEHEISSDNVCTILNHSILYDEQELTAKCLDYIAPRCTQLLQSDQFLNLSRPAFSRFLASDLLLINSEKELFEACVRWAAHQSSKDTSLAVRSCLGRDIGQVRFASMTAVEFAQAAGDSEILSDEEKSMMYYYLLTGRGAPCLRQRGFSLEPRVRKCVRYSSLGRTAGWWTCNGPGDAINVSVDQPITLIGVAVYGGRDPADHKVSLELWDGEHLISTTSKDISSDGTETLIPLYLTGPRVDLEPDVTYTIQVTMKGPIAYYGQGGTETIQRSGVTFTFSRSEKSGNGTNVRSGQIPELLFLPVRTDVTHYTEQPGDDEP